MDKHNNEINPSLGMIYENRKDKKDRVVPFARDGNIVIYAPEGSSSELRMEVREFLDTFVRLDNEAVLQQRA